MRIIICALAALLLSGCWEAEPDGDTMSDLRSTVAGFPEAVKGTMAKWAANRIAYGYMLAHRYDSPIGYMDCPGVGRFPVFVRDMLDCLNRHQTTSYAQCFNHILANHYDNSGLIFPDSCAWTHLPEYHPDNMPDEFDPKRIGDERIAWAMIGVPPPPLEIQLMILGLPGMAGPKGVLCTQGVDWACAPDLFDGDPATPSGSSSSGGDR